MPAPYFAKPYGDWDRLKVEAAYRVASDGRLRERVLMVRLSLEGHRASFIASIVARDVDTVVKWLHRWNAAGFSGLSDRPYSGRPPTLTASEEEQMLAWVLEQVASGKRLPCKRIAFWLQKTCGKVFNDDSVRRLLHKHKCSWQKAGTRDHRADPEAQAAFLEKLERRMEAEPETRFFFSDEAIFRLATTTTYTWSKQGERPIVPTNLSHEKLIEMGAVEPKTGESFHLFVSETTKETFSIFLKEFAKAFPEGNIVFIHDGASWHKVSSPAAHIELWKLPPYSPELNASEPLWKWIRDNVTHNEFFETFEHLEQALTACLRDEKKIKEAILSGGKIRLVG